MSRAGQRVQVKADHWTGMGARFGRIDSGRSAGGRVLVIFDDGTPVDMDERALEPEGTLDRGHHRWMDHQPQHRRNPALTAEQIAATADSAGFTDLAGLLRMGGDLADELAATINAALAQPARSAAAPAVSPRRYTVQEAVNAAADEAVRLIVEEHIDSESALEARLRPWYDAEIRPYVAA